jgi:DNA-binding transcriptional ArsR family regulator
MDEVFKALGDPTRRLLLDRLFERDGRTLGELEAGLEMSRFGVMKHLRVLEAAGLVLTRRRGREKLHFLNPVPIRLVHDRWVSKYAAPWASALSDLKRDLEDETMEKVFEIYIKATPERIWQAITDGEMRRRFSFGVGVESDGRPGPLHRHDGPGDGLAGHADLRGREPRGRPAPPARAELPRAVGRGRRGGGHVARDLGDRARGDSCRLTVTHDQLRDGANDQLFGGWPMILSGLKTLLETGET